MPTPHCSPPYLGWGTGGEVGQVPDPGSCPWVTGADEDGGTDLHGVPVAGSLGGLVCHAEGSEGVALLGVLLAFHLALGRSSSTSASAGQSGARCQPHGRRRCHRHRLRRQRHVTAGGGGRARLVHLHQLLGRFIQLHGDEKGKMKKSCTEW